MTKATWNGLVLSVYKKERIEARVFDKEDVYTNYTVQILTNTVTGDVSVGWWRNDKMPYGEPPMEE